MVEQTFGKFGCQGVRRIPLGKCRGRLTEYKSAGVQHVEQQSAPCRRLRKLRGKTFKNADTDRPTTPKEYGSRGHKTHTRRVWIFLKTKRPTKCLPRCLCVVIRLRRLCWTITSPKRQRIQFWMERLLKKFTGSTVLPWLDPALPKF